MKKLTVKGKLSLNKETIAKLNNEDLLNVNGATGLGCTNTCTTNCPTVTNCTGGTTSKGQYCCYAPCW